MQRQPLAKQPARGQPLPNRLKMLNSVERARPVPRRMKKIRYNDVIISRCRSDIPTRVCDVQVQRGILLRREVERLELWQHLSHFGHQFHAITLQIRSEEHTL